MIVPRVARIHYLEGHSDYHTTVTGLDEETGLNKVFKAIADVADLAAAIAFVLSILAQVDGSGVVQSAAAVGNLHALADNIKATYPSGFIPAAM
jgi:hypothetical protein